MKLAAVYFDDTVCIPGGKDVGGGARRQDLRESTFHVDDGWRIEMSEQHGTLLIWREGMERPAYVGGYGYTYVPADGQVTKTLVEMPDGACATVSEPVPTTPKRRRK